MRICRKANNADLNYKTMKQGSGYGEYANKR